MRRQILASLIVCACQSTKTTTPPETTAVTDLRSIQMQDPTRDLKDGDAVYLQLSDGSVHPMGATPPTTFHVPGRWEEDHFVPTGQVEGDGELATQGSPGWMELITGRFQPAQTARPPFPPYVEGRMTADGFVPSSRQVR